VFIPEHHNITFAEMGKKTKNTISHRARALTKLLHFLAE
ncbi:MAG: non-canonical purine NTP pyrophosphatase, partial [Bacteroidota bacterium]